MISKVNSINKFTSLLIFLLFISSQSSPNNKFLYLTYISLILVSIFSFLKLILKNVNQTKNFYYGLIIIGFLSIFIFTQNYDSYFELFNQYIRIVYPWYLTILFIFTIRPYEKDQKKLFEIISFSSILIYVIVMPDIISIFLGLLTNPSSIFLLKGYTIIYPEANTTAYLIVFNIIFRNELKLAGKKENIAVFLALLITISRSTLIIYFVYIFYKSIKKIINVNNSRMLDKYFSRSIPFLGIITLIIARINIIQKESETWQLFSLNDLSFKARLYILDYLKYFIENINLESFYKLFFGFGWQGKDLFSEGVLGTRGHTLPGMIPEIGLIYVIFIILFFYKLSWKGQLAESLILTLSLTIFIPISYIMPIFCLTILKNKLLILSSYQSKLKN